MRFLCKLSDNYFSFLVCVVQQNNAASHDEAVLPQHCSSHSVYQFEF